MSLLGTGKDTEEFTFSDKEKRLPPDADKRGIVTGDPNEKYRAPLPTKYELPGTNNWIVGWSAIYEKVGLVNPRTYKKWAEKYGFPLRWRPDGKPVVIPYEVDMWLVAFSEAYRGIDSKVLSMHGDGTSGFLVDRLREKILGGEKFNIHVMKMVRKEEHRRMEKDEQGKFRRAKDYCRTTRKKGVPRSPIKCTFKPRDVD